MWFKKILTRLFGYSRRERTGSYILLVILFLLVSWRFYTGRQSELIVQFPGEELLYQQKEGEDQNREAIDINRADSAMFEQLPGIGPVLSARIIKFRNILGGFVSVNQLREVYGLSDEVIELNRDTFICDSTVVNKLDVNNASYSDLLRHPYINRDQVNLIMDYRRISGNFRDEKELITNNIFTSEEIVRLKLYLLFED